MNNDKKVPLLEKIGYALGDGAANISWRGVATFLFIYYTDVFGLDPVTVGILFLVARSGDGISDVLMGILGDRTRSKYGKFRPWILWTAIPLAVILSLLFTSPDFGDTGKIVYAYITYIAFTLIYTANNIPYGALMAVMTGDDKERTSIGSYRMAGAFTGGMLVQGALLFLVVYFGNVSPEVSLEPLVGEQDYRVEVTASQDVANAHIKTAHGFATFLWESPSRFKSKDQATKGKSFAMEQGKTYSFLVTGEKGLSPASFEIVDQQKGYSYSIYSMSVVLAVLMLITFLTTKERIQPPKEQKSNLRKDFKDLVSNRPWVVLLVIGLLFNIYNSIKQGITLIYFTHYLNDQLLSASYLVGLMLASIVGAMATTPLARKYGKRNLFIFALLFSGGVNALLFFCGPSDIAAIFSIGILSEFAAAFFPTLFFVMLGDSADYSEWKNGRRATGLIYSAGSFATKFGGGLAGAIIGFVLGAFHYNGQDLSTIENAVPGIIMLMSWVPTLVAMLGAIVMFAYPLTHSKMGAITAELHRRRNQNSIPKSTK